jgi:hypothetical protein
MAKIRRAIEFSLCLGIACSAWGQSALSANQTAMKSSCSNIVALSGAKVDCSNLTPAQMKALQSIPEILKTALENQGYLDAIMKKLDELASQRSKPIQQETITADHGIAIGGNAQVQSPVVNNNNYAPLPRRISDDDKKQLSSCLAKNPGEFSVAAVMGDSEAQILAMDWIEVFKDAGWKGDSQFGTLMSGTPKLNVQVIVRGFVNEEKTTVRIAAQSPEGVVANCLLGWKGEGDGSIVPDPNQPTAHVTVHVGSRPPQ